MMTYSEFNDIEFTSLRRQLTPKKDRGGDVQKEFLEAVKDSNKFINWIEERVSIEDGKQFVSFSEQLSESTYDDIPPREAQSLYNDKWHDITPAQACKLAFWGKVTLEHIRERRIESHFLAGKGSEEGLARIDKELKSDDAAKIDQVVRTVIRKFCGLKEERGNRGVYVDCRFARAWWRAHIANEICETATNSDPTKIIKSLRTSQSYWEELIVLIVSRNSVMGDVRVRSALVWALSEQNKSLVDELKKIVKAIGVRLAWQELAVYEIDELKKIIDDIITQQ